MTDPFQRGFDAGWNAAWGRALVVAGLTLLILWAFS